MTSTNDVPDWYAVVVDDDLIILMDAVGILTDAGFRALEARNVDSAIRVLEKFGDEIVVMFTDVQMPGRRNGFDLARLTAERWPSIGILVASGMSKPKPGDMPAGAVFVGKPFSADIVYAHLQSLCRREENPIH